MKLSQIKELYTKTAVSKLDDNFFKDLYRVSIDAIESIADTIIREGFSKATEQYDTIEEIKVFLNKEKNEINVYFIGKIIYEKVVLDNKKHFNFQNFIIWINLNSIDEYICFEWDNDGFNLDLADKIFGKYIIKRNNNSSIWVSLDFFNS